MSASDASPPGRTATVQFTNQAVDGRIDTVEIEVVFPPDGGYVIMHDVAPNEVSVEPPVGATEFLHPGRSTNVTAEVTGSQHGGNLPNPAETQSLIAMPHRDEPGDGVITFPEGDPPSINGGFAVIDIGLVAVD